MKIIGIIPARAGSKGIPGKNKKILAGKPLINYTIEAALESKLDKLVISTDDEDIIRLGVNKGVEVIKRPAELSEDWVPTLPVLQHVMASQTEEFDAVMTLQPTSPLRKAKHINEAIDLFESNESADSLVSVIQIPHNITPGSLMIVKGSWLVSYFDTKKQLLRRQEKPKLFARNGASIYITRINRIHEYIFGGNLLPYLMNKIESIDIDDHKDWQLAELIIKSGILNDE